MPSIKDLQEFLYVYKVPYVKNPQGIIKVSQRITVVQKFNKNIDNALQYLSNTTEATKVLEIEKEIEKLLNHEAWIKLISDFKINVNWDENTQHKEFAILDPLYYTLPSLINKVAQEIDKLPVNSPQRKLFVFLLGNLLPIYFRKAANIEGVVRFMEKKLPTLVCVGYPPFSYPPMKDAGYHYETKLAWRYDACRGFFPQKDQKHKIHYLLLGFNPTAPEKPPENIQKQVTENIDIFIKRISSNCEKKELSGQLDFSQKVNRVFPKHQIGLNYALSDEPILLNGMKVIFDQQASVYPVSLQVKDRQLLNTSLAKRLGNSNHFSDALSLPSWKTILKLEIGKTRDIKGEINLQKVKLNNKKTKKYRQGRLETIASKPWTLDQGFEGTCGFASVIMAMLYLANKKTNKQKVIIDLLDAIYNRQDYKQMRFTEQGFVINRLENILSKYLHERTGSYSPKNLADYVLNVGLLNFFRDHLKNNSDENKQKMWEKIKDFNKIFPGFEEQRDQLNKGGTAKSIRELKDNENVIPGYKKGDLGMTIEALLELCQIVGIAEENTEPIILDSSKEYNNRLGKYTWFESTFEYKVGKKSFLSHFKFLLKFNEKDFEMDIFPCILALTQGDMFMPKGGRKEEEKKRKEKEKEFANFDFVEHWVFMPNRDSIWTYSYGMKKTEESELRKLIKSLTKYKLKESEVNEIKTQCKYLIPAAIIPLKKPG